MNALEAADAIYELPYAEEHLTELFQEARDGEGMIIVKRDDPVMPIVPLAPVKDRAQALKKFKIPGLKRAC